MAHEADKPVIVIEPASPEIVYVPYYEPAVVYGAWPYSAYPPYYFPPAPGYIVGGALVSGIAWGAGFAIGNAIWDGFDWGRGNIHVDIDKNVNINRNVNKNNVNVGNWQHNSYHRRGVNYGNKSVQNKFANADVRSGDRKLDYRGRGGQEVLKPGNKAGDGDRPNLGGQGSLQGKKPDLGKGPGNKLDLGKGPGGSQDKRPGQGQAGPASKKPDLGKGQGGAHGKVKQAALEGKKPDLGKAKQTARSGGNAFDASDGAKAGDFAKRGQASLGNRGASEFARPKGGGGHAISKGGGGPRVGGGGGRHGGGGRGGGRRR